MPSISPILAASKLPTQQVPSPSAHAALAMFCTAWPQSMSAQRALATSFSTTTAAGASATNLPVEQSAPISFRRSRLSTTMKRHGCRLRALIACRPASTIFRSASDSTGRRSNALCTRRWVIASNASIDVSSIGLATRLPYLAQAVGYPFMAGRGPLDGYRIIDVTSMISGPLATQILADQGADVVKVENPDGGDHTRAAPNRRGGLSAAFLNNNRNKRSITINLRHERGRAVLMRLVSHADVFVQNF